MATKKKPNATAAIGSTFELAKRIITIDRDRLNAVAADETEQDERRLIAVGQQIEALNNALHWLGVYEGIGA